MAPQPPIRLSGDSLRKFLAKNGNLPPVKTFVDPTSLSQVALVKSGKKQYMYSVYEANEYLHDETIQKYADKFDKSMKKLANKDDAPQGE